MTKVSAIVALGKDSIIGKGSELLWRIPDDLARFKKITIGHPVIMGRKTFESIGRPLPKRPNIIITRDKSFEAESCLVTHSIEDAIEEARDLDYEEIFIIGGGEIYKQALPQTDKLYLTLIDDEKNGNVFFPDYSEFTKEISREEREYEGLKYAWVDLERG